MRSRPACALAAVAVMAASTAAAAEIAGRVANAKGDGIAEAVVFVQSLPNGAPPPAPVRAVLDQVNKEFVPHVLPVVVGSEVSFPNHDQIHHHVYSFSRITSFEIPLYKGEEAPPVLFDKLGAIKVGCNIHDWMSAVILVLPAPYFAVTGADGSYRIEGVPPGRYSLAVWHEGAKAKPEDTPKTVEVGEGRAEASFSLEVEPPAARVPLHGLRSYE